jgi:hypothetical protein
MGMLPRNTMMANKWKYVSYKAKSSALARRQCPRCKRKELCDRVDYGEGGVTLFFACGEIKELSNSNNRLPGTSYVEFTDRLERSS